MNMWTDDNTSMMEAFFMTSGLTSLWPPPPSSFASTSIHLPPPPIALFNPDTLQHRLQALIEGARENWTYAIFWKSTTNDFPGGPGPVLGWGDGYYKGEEDKGKRKTASTLAEEQAHRKIVLRELNSLISGAYPSENDAVDEEVTDTEWFFLVSMTQSWKHRCNVIPTFEALSLDEVVKSFMERLCQTVDSEDIDYIVQFKGPKESLYEGGTWKVRVKFPEDYPHSPPSLAFVNPIFHPNISQTPLGRAGCVDLLGWEWDAGFGLLKVFEEILPGLLVQLNPASPYNREASELLLMDEKAYAERVKANAG
ncbi:hypothetical protein RHSIM_Rhsim12G0162700 [Rhododendron simsii]|uniref:Transcription factor n=1 Tax=Rhododendron simsii TaxID=118357 RepID=A0A834G701_RHOSS|nr:hypothetical protein RHSIM_Rhsim12G0162700 [Rhododendron simsii]